MRYKYIRLLICIQFALDVESRKKNFIGKMTYRQTQTAAKFALFTNSIACIVLQLQTGWWKIDIENLFRSESKRNECRQKKMKILVTQEMWGNLFLDEHFLLNHHESEVTCKSHISISNNIFHSSVERKLFESRIVCQMEFNHIQIYDRNWNDAELLSKWKTTTTTKTINSLCPECRHWCQAKYVFFFSAKIWYALALIVCFIRTIFIYLFNFVEFPFVITHTHSLDVHFYCNINFRFSDLIAFIVLSLSVWWLFKTYLICFALRRLRKL